MIELSDKQKDMILNASGLTRSKVAYRSHYCTNPDNPEWLNLVEIGLAKGPDSDSMNSPNLAYFWLTELGIDIAYGIKRRMEVKK